MVLVSKEPIEKCRRSSDLKKLTYAVGRPTADKLVSDKLHLTKVSGAKKRKVYTSKLCTTGEPVVWGKNDGFVQENGHTSAAYPPRSSS